MRIKIGTILVLAGLCLFFAQAARSAVPFLTILEVYDEEDCLCVDFYLKNGIDKDLLTSIQNGIPALLTYRVDLWKDRTNWYDKLLKTVTYSYKVTYDNWDTLYVVDVFRSAEQEVGRAPNVASLIHFICNQKGMKACRLADLDPDALYYLTISANIEELSAERVKEIESWLGGSDETDDAGGGLLGFVVGLFTAKGERAETRSDLFSIEGLGR